MSIPQLHILLQLTNISQNHVAIIQVCRCDRYIPFVGTIILCKIQWAKFSPFLNNDFEIFQTITLTQWKKSSAATKEVLRKVSVTQQKYTGFSSKSEEWSPSQSPFRYSIWQLGSFFERHMRSLSSFDFVFHQDVVIIWGKQPWYYIFIDSLFISRALFYDILKSALQAFWKCGTDGANKFIHRHNYAGEIAIYDKYYHSKNVQMKVSTKVTLSDQRFLTLWRFPKWDKSRISEFTCCQMLSHAVKGWNHVRCEKERKCRLCCF